MIALHILASNSNSFEKIRNTFGDAGQRVESWWKVHLENNESEHKGGFFYLIIFIPRNTPCASNTSKKVTQEREAPFCCFYMVISQMALDPPPFCQTGKRGKKSAPNHPGKPLHPPPFRAMPIWKQHISKRGFP